jgi:hypothetical protein
LGDSAVHITHLQPNPWLRGSPLDLNQAEIVATEVVPMYAEAIALTFTGARRIHSARGDLVERIPNTDTVEARNFGEVPVATDEYDAGCAASRQQLK